MIPNIPILTEKLTEPTYPNRTYKIVFRNENLIDARNLVSLNMETTVDSDRISGYIDDLESVIQAIYLILSTERYKFIIYSWDYGVELVDLIGQPMSYVRAELPRRIKEALIQDNRVTDVIDFEFKESRGVLHTRFTVVTGLGNISTEMGVAV